MAKRIADIASGLYEVKGNIMFLTNQTGFYAHFTYLYMPDPHRSTKRNGLGHPAAGFRVKKTNVDVRRLQRHEITASMRAQWRRRLKQACVFVCDCSCRKLPKDQI